MTVRITLDGKKNNTSIKIKKELTAITSTHLKPNHESLDIELAEKIHLILEAKIKRTRRQNFYKIQSAAHLLEHKELEIEYSVSNKPHKIKWQYINNNYIKEILYKDNSEHISYYRIYDKRLKIWQ